MRGLLPARTIYYYPIYQYNWTMKKFFLSLALIIDIIAFIIWITVGLFLYLFLLIFFAPSESSSWLAFTLYDSIEFYIILSIFYFCSCFFLFTSIKILVLMLKQQRITLVQKIFLLWSIIPIGIVIISFLLNL